MRWRLVEDKKCRGSLFIPYVFSSCNVILFNYSTLRSSIRMVDVATRIVCDPCLLSIIIAYRWYMAIAYLLLLSWWLVASAELHSLLLWLCKGTIL